MTLLEKLSFLMQINEIKNLHKLSELSNVPYTTYRTMFNRGVDNISLETGRKICNFFDLTLDELLIDETDLPEFVENDDKSSNLKVKRKYPRLDYKKALEVANQYREKMIDLSGYDKDTQDLILKIIDMNKKNKQKGSGENDR